MNFKIPHQTSKSDAKSKVARALQDARPHLKDNATIDEERWEGDTLHFAATLQGKQISGTLEVTDTDLIVDATLPLMWRLFEGRIEKMIAQHLQQMNEHP
jgi:hypothetical protein